jgi:AraC family transcriptional regulator, transcriptional activator of pobA
MDDADKLWYFWNMTQSPPPIPAYALYGEGDAFPDILHCERITDRAALHDWRIAPHRHPNLHQIFLLSAGAAEIGVDGHRRILPLPAVLSLPRWSVHEFTFAQGTEGFVLTLPVAEFPAAFAAHSPLAPRLAQWGALPLTPEIAAAMQAISTAHAGAAFDRRPMLQALALQLFCLVARSLESARPAALSRSARHMEAFDLLLRGHLRDRWRVADYARELALTATHLNRIARAHSGLPAARYIETRLFHEACRLLAYTRMTIAEVGYQLGFEDPAYFSRAFRRHLGESPRDYRARLEASGRAADTGADNGADNGEGGAEVNSGPAMDLGVAAGLADQARPA